MQRSEVTVPVAVDDQLAIKHRARRDLPEHRGGDFREVHREGLMLPGLQRSCVVESVEGQAAMS